jgi:hypothetical protein
LVRSFSLLEDFNCFVQILLFQLVAKVDHLLIQLEVDVVTPIFNDDTGFARCTFNSNYVTLVGNVIDDYLVGVFDVLPDTQVASVLRYHNIRQWDPLDLTAVVQKGGFGLCVDIADG